MKQYKLTEQEARALAWEIAHQNAAPPRLQRTDEQPDIAKFMNVYNRTMSAIDDYNDSVSDGLTD